VASALLEAWMKPEAHQDTIASWDHADAHCWHSCTF